MAKKTQASSVPTPVVDSRAIVVSMKGTVAYRDWLNGLAEHCRSTGVQVIDSALVAYAKQVGYAVPAPKRTEGR